jgi:hypothetical protein
VNSIAYCAQAVYQEAQIMAGAAPPHKPVEAPFTAEELRAFLESNIAALRGKPKMEEVTESLRQIAEAVAMQIGNLEELEQRLSALEDKMKAIVRTTQSDEDLFEARRELDSTLRPYRGKMTADQLAMLEKQYLDRNLLEKAALPRLSLFYLR